MNPKEEKKMTKKIIILGSIISVFLLSGNAMSGEPNMKEGLWEITVQMEMPGMPMEMPSHKFNQCITRDKAVPEDPAEKDKDCKMDYKNVTKDTVVWKVVCKDREGGLTGEGSITYKGDTFTGETKVKESGGMEITQKMKGRWIGPCPKQKK
jgi:hypothetical protein